MKKTVLALLSASALAGCASEQEDYWDGLNSFPDPTIELPVQGYQMFAELRLTNSQALKGQPIELPTLPRQK